MQTQEIPSQDWTPFFDQLSQSHQGDPVSIELQSREIGCLRPTKCAKLVGITFDPKDSVGHEIDVIIRGDSQVHLMHAIQHPSHVRIARTDDGFDSALQLESDDGPTTLVRFLERNSAESD